MSNLWRVEVRERSNFEKLKLSKSRDDYTKRIIQNVSYEAYCTVLYVRVVILYETYYTFCIIRSAFQPKFTLYCVLTVLNGTFSWVYNAS